MNTRDVNKLIDQLRTFVDVMDTTKEVRASTGYLFLIGLSDRLTELGMNEPLAVRAAARVNCNLPADFQREYPEQFAELVRLYAKQLFVLWKTCLADFDDELYEEVYLQLVSTSAVG